MSLLMLSCNAKRRVFSDVEFVYSTRRLKGDKRIESWRPGSAPFGEVWGTVSQRPRLKYAVFSQRQSPTICCQGKRLGTSELN